MNIIQEAEDKIIEFLLDVPDESCDIDDMNDLFNVFNEEAEEELKDYLWEQIKYNLNIRAILDRLKIELPPKEEEEDDEEEKEEEDED